MSNGTFKCCRCGETFEKNFTDEQARKNFEEEFPGIPFQDDLPMACEDCFQEMNAEESSVDWALNHTANNN